MIMREDVHNPPLLNLISAIKGFLAGGFMSLAVFTEWDPVARVLLFVIGFFMFVDAVMPVDRGLYAVTSVFFLIVGGLIGFFTAVAGSGLAYLVLMLIAAVVIYLDKLRRMREAIK
jgi:hypothetical protein